MKLDFMYRTVFIPPANVHSGACCVLEAVLGTGVKTVTIDRAPALMELTF